jgi:hypothetical protein
MKHEVQNVLSKRADGVDILLDWNAFDAAFAITVPQLKGIHWRLLKQYPYGQVAAALRHEVKKERSHILAVAKDKIHVRVLQECQNMELKVNKANKVIVSSRDLLKQWLREKKGMKCDSQFKQFTETCFAESQRWNKDMAHNLMDKFAIRHDPPTVLTHSNNNGYGFFEKICTKALQNLRQDLRAVRATSTSARRRNIR